MDALNPRKLNRDQLAKFLPSHELIKAFEALFNLAGATPDEINALTELVEGSQQDADTARASAVAATSIAHIALSIARELNEGPTPQYLQLAEQVDDLTARLSASEARAQDLSRRIDDLQERPTP